MRPLRTLSPVLCLFLAACARKAEPPNVLLVSIDTLRQDHVSCYGYRRETTPNLDALAAEGVRFTHAQSPRAKTTPAMASVLTGLYPQEHGVRDLTTPLGNGPATLAEVLRSARYRTGAVVGNYVLTRELSGLDRGFDVYADDLPHTQGVPPDDVPQRRAASVTDGALGLLGLGPNDGEPIAGGDRPWFLWVHYMDPHGLYDPPEEHSVFTSDSKDPIPPPDRPGDREAIVATYNVPADAWLPDGRVDANRMRDRYDGEIHYADAEIGRLLGRMRKMGLLERTWVIVVSDHGESFGEHRYWFEHGRYAYEATCRVPLIVHAPLSNEDRPTGVRHADVSLVDLMPTILELADIPRPSSVRGASPRGESRAGVLAEDDGLAHAVFCEKVERSEKARSVQAKAVRLGDWKLVRHYAQPLEPGGEMELVEEELFDLADDPSETRNLIGEPPAACPLPRLRDRLLAFWAADETFADMARVLQEHRDALRRDDPEALRRLEAMGY